MARKRRNGNGGKAGVQATKAAGREWANRKEAIFAASVGLSRISSVTAAVIDERWLPPIKHRSHLAIKWPFAEAKPPSKCPSDAADEWRFLGRTRSDAH